MTQINVYLDEEEDNILKEYCKKHDINSKVDGIKKMIKDSKEVKNGISN